MHMCPSCGVSLSKFEPLVLGNVEVTAGHDIVFNGKVVTFSGSQTRILVETLIRGNGRTMTREVLLNAIDSDGSDRSIDVYISRARRAFRTIDPAFDQIVARRDLGYAWLSKGTARQRIAA
jgi:DNA-binding response OmpR family regulator